MNGVERNRVSNYSSPAGFGYIVVPSGSDRDMYVKDCFRKERVSIQLDSGGGVIKNCFISRKALQEVEFPLLDSELGSCVAFIVPDFHNIPIIVAVISKADDTQLLDENSFQKIVSTKNASVSISGKGSTGDLFINVESNQEDEGNINITLKNKGNTSKFNLSCFGDVNIYAEGKVALKSLNEVNLESIYIEEGIEKLSSQIQLNRDGFILNDRFSNKVISDQNGKIKIHEGSNPAVKGEELKKQLEALHNRLDNLILAIDTSNELLTTAETTTKVSMKASLAAIDLLPKESFDNINSIKLYLD
jgi:hypothetical protein